jgi:hypothetical protein
MPILVEKSLVDVGPGGGAGDGDDADPAEAGATEARGVVVEELIIVTDEVLGDEVGVEVGSTAQVVGFAAASVKYSQVTVFPSVVLWKYIWQTVESYGGCSENIHVYGDRTGSSTRSHEAVPGDL